MYRLPKGSDVNSLMNDYNKIDNQVKIGSSSQSKPAECVSSNTRSQNFNVGVRNLNSMEFEKELNKRLEQALALIAPGKNFFLVLNLITKFNGFPFVTDIHLTHFN